MADKKEEEKGYVPPSGWAKDYIPKVIIEDPPTEYEKMYPTNHLLILGPRNPFRKLCVAIAYSKAFDMFILLAIFVNCVFMAMNSQLPSDDKSQMNALLESFEIYLLGIFCGEAFFKIVAQGLILHQDAFLRNGWNMLDFIVVTTGILGIPSIGNAIGFSNAGPMKVIKAARVLRPLKLVSGVPSLQVVMSAILKSMVSLLQICLLIGFVIILYAIIGLSLFQGKFHYTCFYPNTSVIYKVEGEIILCSISSAGRQCPPDAECNRYWSGPNYGITSFDNMLLASLTVFVCITCEGWTNTMYMSYDVMDYGKTFVWMYYFSLNVLGAQFMLNLVCGVLSGEFSREKERVENRRKFLESRQEERSVEKYEEWIDKGDVVAAMTEEEIMKHTGEGLSGFAKFKLKSNKIRIRLKPILMSWFMFWLILFLVFCNSVMSAMQHYNQPQWTTDLLGISNFLFLGFFFLEMCIRLYALGPSLYFASKFNKFDFVIVVGGVLNLISSKVFGIDLGIPVLRQLRLMKLFKFTSYWPALKNLMKSILESMTSILSLLLLLFLFLMIFALLGMQLFGGTFQNTIPPARTNFDDFFNALFAVFQVTTGEDWNFVMYEGVMANGGPKDPKGLAMSLYFVAATVLGNYVLLNVFLAIAVDNLTMTAEEKESMKQEAIENEEHMSEVREKYSPKNSGEGGEGEEENAEEAKEEEGEVQVGEFDTVPTEGGTQAPGEGFLENLKEPGRMTGNIPTPASSKMLQENTLFICFPKNPIRRLIYFIVSSPRFDNTLLALILISSGLLTIEDATNPDAQINLILKYLDFGFTGIFTLEVVLKIINFGLILHPGSYCRDTWNCADMVVVCCAITSLVLSSKDNASPTVKQIVKILRILRVLRPLKSINKLPKLKAVFQCTLYSLQNVVNILMITLQFLFIFSVMGVQLFAGKMWYCSDVSKEFEDECHGTYIDFEEVNYYRPIEKERNWARYDFNFDNVFESIITLFSSSTGEGWPLVMQHGIDSQEYDQGPIRNSKIWISIYFIVFVILFSFFFINVFVGMIILTFQALAAAEFGGELDRNKKNSLVFAMSSRPLEKFVPENVGGWQYKVWALVESNFWEAVVMGLISINTMVLMLEFDDQPAFYKAILDQVNEIFTFVFTVEFIFKIAAFGKNYFKDFWNNFDLLIVVGSLFIFLITKATPELLGGFDPGIFRLVRALRLVKLLRRVRPLRILLWTFIQSLKALPYVGMLIFLLFFVYGIIGMQIFSRIDLNQKEAPWNNINRNNNFRSYFSSTAVLFRVASGEGWPDIMLACTSKAKCDESLVGVKPGDTCGTDASYFYFISFIFFCTFLMLNLFIAVIMDSFSFLTEDQSILGPHHLDEFVVTWAEFDPAATGRIKHTELVEFLRAMVPPLGLGAKCPKIVAYKRLIQMNMSLLEDGMVDYTGTFFALVRTGLNLYTDNTNLESNNEAIITMLKTAFPNITKKTLDLSIGRLPKNAKDMTIGKMYAAKLIWKKYKEVTRGPRVPPRQPRFIRYLMELEKQKEKEKEKKKKKPLPKPPPPPPPSKPPIQQEAKEEKSNNNDSKKDVDLHAVAKAIYTGENPYKTCGIDGEAYDGEYC